MERDRSWELPVGRWLDRGSSCLLTTTGSVIATIGCSRGHGLGRSRDSDDEVNVM
jgi:hypothetical protein